MQSYRSRPRLFLGNFDFEHRLADPKWEPNEKLNRLNAEMASAWSSIAEDGDFIWTPLPFDNDFLNAAKREGLPDVFLIQSLADVPRNVECIPWGWSPEIQRLSEQFGWETNSPTVKAVRLANSRRTSADLEQQWNVGLPGAKRIQSLEDLDSAIQSLNDGVDRWVVKAEFGMSARERILGKGLARDTDKNWVRRRLTQQGIVFFEPWVDRISEVGIQINIPTEGTPTLVGLTPIHVDGRGQYAGSWFAFSEANFPSELALWEQAVEVALRAANHLQKLGYFGPVGIDAMIYRDLNCSPQVRPLQDINARWTMGRLSLGWKKLVGPRDEGFWRHGTDESWIPNGYQKPDRRFETSPKTVGPTLCAHQTSVFLWKNDEFRTSIGK